MSHAAINPVAGALAHAITNDRYGRGGVVSRNDARSIMDAAIADISSSADPAATFAHDARFITAAESMLGRSAEARNILSSYQARGMSAVNARLALLGQDLELPAEAKKAVANFVGWRVDPSAVTLTNEKKTGTDSFTFDWAHGNETGKGFATKFMGEWIVSPIEFDPAILPNVLKEAQAHFDNVVVPWAGDYESDDELADYRSSIRITGLSVNHNPDDEDKTDEGWLAGFPYEFDIDGGAPGDGGLYVGFKPDTGDLNGFGRWA
jgi:hypothetical protein